MPFDIAYILFLVFASAAVVQIAYYWLVFGRLAFYREKDSSEIEKQPVSVVICARNELENLKNNLPLILEQDYPDYEVVVVNHCSDDDSDSLLKDFSLKYEHLKVVTINKDLNFFSGKKFPLSVGVKSAQNDVLLLTDADCRPEGDQWVNSMQSKFVNGVEIVLGYGQYEKRKGLLNMLIRYETLFTAIHYFSLALSGMPYMGVGRNLAYRKSLFFRNKGFSSHLQTMSGDDDLFINEAATKKNTAIQINSNSYTYSVPKESFAKWFTQKRRHLTTGKLYKKKHKFILGLFSLSQFLFYTFLIVLVCLQYNKMEVLALFIVRGITHFVVIKYCINRLNKENLLLISPLLEFILVVIFPLLYLIGLVSKKNKWE